MILLAVLLAAQADPHTPVCSGTADESNCRSEDGDVYVERRLVNQTVRQGTLANGTSWTEYLSRAFDGVRLEGSDSTGRHWSLQCNPRYGITGIDRNGNTVYVPPRSRVPVVASDDDRSDAVSNPIGSDQPPANACSGL